MNQAPNQQPSNNGGGHRPAPFTVEFGDDNNRTITLNALKLRIRGRFSIVQLHNRPEGGRDVGRAMTQMPMIPGMRMEVDPRAGTYRLYDPLQSDSELLDRINNVISIASAAARGGKYTHVPEVHDKLNADQMKSLVLDLYRLVKEKSARVVGDTPMPNEKQIAAMDGDELFDPWNSSSRKPRYAKDADKYYEALEKQIAS